MTAMYRENKYKNFTAKEIKPEGWLKKQLEIQMEGLSGNLYKVWPDIRDCSWIGGEIPSWERVPYWLDGFIPLAYLLEDEEKIAVAKKYVDGIIADQKEDGWICPCKDEERAHYDTWVAFLICKMLVVYYECSNDERVENVVSKALKCIYAHLRLHTIREWGSSRWYECLIPVYWLYERTHEEWLLNLATTLYAQGMDHKILFRNWYDKEPRNEWTYETHVVNLAMALKSEALMAKSTDFADTSFPKKMLELLDKYHGTAVGHFTGDECLSGKSPIQGTELCGVVEAMYSYEVLFSVTGDHYWLDRLEKVAFNALPATISEDMWTHQYLQQTNQMACVTFADKNVFRTNGPEAHIFGLEPNYGCCTANFNQGWPKFALSTYLRSDEGLVSAVLAPASVKTEINEVPVVVSLKTEYPFQTILEYTIETQAEVNFTLSIHVPEKAKNLRVNGKKMEQTEELKINKNWNGIQTVTVEFDFETEFNERDHELFTISRGPIVFALPIQEEWKMREYVKDGIERKYPYCDYDIYPKSKWNYGFVSKNTVVHENGITKSAFSKTNPPIELEVEMAEIDWKLKEGFEYLCNETPDGRQPLSEAKKIKLRPYGCTTLRMTEIPFVER